MTPAGPPGHGGVLDDPAPPPSLRRRLAAFVYEGVLLLGIVAIGAYLYGTLTQQRHALVGRTGLQLLLFVLVGIYFVWFWTHGGQTVAMKTWHIRLVDAHGRGVSQSRALARYVLAWLWFVPALLTAQAWAAKSTGIVLATVATVATVTLGAVYALLALTNPQRQFLHDLVCGTRLVDTRPKKMSS